MDVQLLMEGGCAGEARRQGFWSDHWVKGTAGGEGRGKKGGRPRGVVLLICYI